MSSNNNIDDIISLTKRRLSFRNKQNYENYHYITDFENTNEKECKKLDNLNEQIYQKNLKYFQTCEKYLNDKKAMFKLADTPKAPRVPSNYDNLILYRNRNQSFNCREQTLAVIYLIYNNYTLVIDKSLPQFKNNELYFEPYMALDLARKVARQHNENYLKVIEALGLRK